MRDSCKMGATKRDLSAKDKEKNLTDAVSGLLEMSDELEQDKMEGVDAKDWEE